MYGKGKKLTKQTKQNIKKPFTSEENKNIKDRIIRDIRHFSKQNKKKKKERNQGKGEKQYKRLIKDKIIRDNRSLFEEEEDCYKPERVSTFWNNNYIDYESNGIKNSSLSLDKGVNKIKTYLRHIIIDIQNSCTWKIQLTAEINFISSKDIEV